MTDREWRRAWEIYLTAWELPEDERGSYLASMDIEPELSREIVCLLEEPEHRTESGLTPGTRMGRYEIRGELGRGGMGQVYLAQDTDLGRMVALKLLAPGVAVTHNALERLIREAKAASALNHPHIVTVYEVTMEGADVAVAMELVEGEPLCNYRGSPQPPQRVIHWGRQAAKALAAAHERGIVHRDIKPENLMVRADGYIKLLDFGLARQAVPEGMAGPANISGLLSGTLNYMPPEQIRGEPATRAGDIFSLGVVLFELAAGQHPFLAGSPIDAAQAIAHNEPKAPSTLNREIPPALDSLLLDMLAKDPRRRVSAQEVDRRLAEIEESAAKPPRRFGKLATASLAACAILGAAFGLLRDRIFAHSEPEFTQITTQTSENGVTVAALSPDGRDLAFATPEGPVEVRRMSDGVTRTLNTPAQVRVDRIAWFADGRRLLVSGLLDERLGIWEIPAGDGEPRAILRDAMEGIPSPDGARIAVTSPDAATIWVVDSKGGSPKYIRRGGDAITFSSLVWSPDSKRVSYQRQEYSPAKDRQVDQGSAQLEKNYRFSYESAEVETGRVVASAPNVVMNSACGLADGRVLFLRWTSFDKTLVREIWQLRTDPNTGRLLGPARALTHGTNQTLSSISAANGGKQVVVVNWSRSWPHIDVADLPPPGQPVRLLHIRRLTFAEGDEYPHAWTPDNRAVIFESNRNGNYDLFQQSLGQREPEPLVVGPSEDVMPQLSPDGKWVLYRTADGGERRLMRVPVGGGKPETVPVHIKWDEFHCPARAEAPCVLRSVEHGQFVFRELDPVRGTGAELARTAWSPTVVGDWAISPDGREVAIPNHDPRDGKLRLIPLGGAEGRHEKTVTLEGLKNVLGVAWAADGRWWFVSVGSSFSASRVDGRLLAYADLTGRTSVLRGSIGTFYAVPSRDGRHVAFPEQTGSSNAWMVRGLE